MTGEQIGISRFKAKKEFHDVIEKDLRKFMDFESAHPEIYHYSSTRYYNMDVPGTDDEEYWMFIDHFKSYEDYRDSLYQATHSPENKEGQRLMAQSLAHASGTFAEDRNPAEIEHWIEVPSLRVDNQGH
ncbi:hypothetical protein [Ligilactobacillus acidipiscis]|uniref:hypothetical protein n=1 Tax=Ligilactobacillus acidipiscis TaxID=89059 RepID=UPI0023F93052|nr:hypothetical protein [Ligilactobacillus acidipiscis]WEV57424.1 hypothetical protein OZX66_02445 [Ligilactobacillus acidipiscis]